MKKYSMTISNVITISRLVLLPIIIYFILVDRRSIAFIIMFVSLLSDGLDGYLARKLNQESRLGRFLDPLCDKIFLAAILITLFVVGAVPIWVLLVIVLRDFLILLGSYFLLKSRSVVEPSNILGKITGFIFGAMILAFTAGWQTIGSVLVYLSIPFMLIAFVVYAINYLRIMRGVS
ncbi:MAG: CDP-alcohol phosphatidyltransferase family protein [candidate division WOR-3 bacterium]|nr:MAG: CDP-alcohol phosphatidyltransferase family protein [candidate division WOR-3 bacterium]